MALIIAGIFLDAIRAGCVEAKRKRGQDADRRAEMQSVRDVLRQRATTAQIRRVSKDAIRAGCVEAKKHEPGRRGGDR